MKYKKLYLHLIFDTELKGTIFMTRLTKYEKETIILTNEEDDFGMCLLITKDCNVGLCPLLNNIQKIVNSRARIMKGNGI